MTKHIIGLVAAFAGAVSFGETIYENDFSERRSASSVPTAGSSAAALKLFLTTGPKQRKNPNKRNFSNRPDKK